MVIIVGERVTDRERLVVTIVVERVNDWERLRDGEGGRYI